VTRWAEIATDVRVLWLTHLWITLRVAIRLLSHSPVNNSTKEVVRGGSSASFRAVTETVLRLIFGNGLVSSNRIVYPSIFAAFIGSSWPFNATSNLSPS